VYLGDELHRGVTTVKAEEEALLASLGTTKPAGAKQLALL